MSWQTLLSKWQMCPTLDSLRSPQEVERMLQEIAAAKPDVYWYPGSGSDLTPLVLDPPGNPTGKRLFPLRGPKQGKNLILWMSDYLDAFWGGPNGFDLGHSGADIERYLRVKVEIVDPVGRFMIATDHVSTGRTVSVPVAVFRVRVCGGNRGYERPAEGDLYTVLFSPTESELLLQQVFVPHAIPVRVVALQRQGGFSVQRSHFKQYRDIPRLLRQHEPQLGRIDAYLVDHNVEIPGYEPWGGADASLGQRRHKDVGAPTREGR
jgi:hypothetical protein